MRSLFSIRREERLPAVVFLLLVLFFQYLMVSKFLVLFADFSDASWRQFIRNYHMSGFDPNLYDVVTSWRQAFEIIRHPLLAVMLYPFHLLNRLLWWATGCNCASLIVSLLLSFCAFYSLVFLFRTMREVIGIGRGHSLLLSVMFFSMAYVMVTSVVADHFCLSMLCLILTACLSGKKMKEKETFSPLETFILITLSAGITLTNGAVVAGMIMITDGRESFRHGNVLAVLSSLLVLAASMAAFSISQAESGQSQSLDNTTKWIRQDISRARVLQENFFGESVQLHRKHVLGDVLRNRPVVVEYSWKAQNIFTVVFELLLMAGLAVGIRRRFTWLLVFVLGTNLLMHIAIGFAITEVHIMAAHWAFTVPLAMAWLFTAGNRHTRAALTVMILLMTVYLLSYNGCLLYRYLTWPLAK